MVHGDRERDKGHKLKQEKSRLDIRRSFFTLKSSKHWSRLPKFNLLVRWFSLFLIPCKHICYYRNIYIAQIRCTYLYIHDILHIKTGGSVADVEFGWGFQIDETSNGYPYFYGDLQVVTLTTTFENVNIYYLKTLISSGDIFDLGLLIWKGKISHAPIH